MMRNSAWLQRLEAIFDRVADLPFSARQAAIDEACGGDALLRKEVEALLARVGDSLPLHLTSTLQAVVRDGDPDPNLGRRLGPYVIRSQIGIGGMGHVYLADQTEPVRRTVALKLMRRGLDTDETIRRFGRERQLLATLTHPNIASLYDAGSTDDGLPYFVMECVCGDPITAFCERTNLDTIHRLKLFRQVCAAVHFAHQNTVIHRDLKPANILVTREGMPKLLDFGIAQLTDPSLTEQPRTRVEDQFLTLEYASPEQIRGEPLNAASDVYSMGVILYEMLTGFRPYDLTGATRKEAAEILDRCRPPAPSEAALRHKVAGSTIPTFLNDNSEVNRSTRSLQLRRELRGNLDCIVLKALRHDSRQRYESAKELSADIQRHLNHEPILATGPGVIYRARRYAHRNRTVIAIIIMLILGLIASSLAGLGAYRSRNAERLHMERLRRVLYAKEMDLAALDLRANLLGSLHKRVAEAPQDLRGWEWEYLQSQMDDSCQSWAGHPGGVTAMAVSSDGKLVASGGLDGSIRTWDSANGKQLRTLSGPQGGVHSIVFMPDGTRIVSGGGDCNVRIWNVESSVESAILPTKSGPAVSVRVSSDGRWIAAGSGEGVITFWNAQTLEPTRFLRGFDGRFDSLSVSPDGKQLAGAGKDHALCLWSVEPGGGGRFLTRFSAPVCSTAFSPDGRILAASLIDGAIQLFDTSTWRVFRTLRKNNVISTCSLAFSPDNQRLASTGRDDRTLTIWDLEKNTRLGEFHGHARKILTAAFSSDGRHIITGAADGKLKVWDGEPVAIPKKVQVHVSAVRSLAFSPDSSVLLTGGTELFLWDLDKAQIIRPLHAHSQGVSAIAYSANGRRFATAGLDGRIQVWDGATATPERQIEPNLGSLSYLSICSDGSRVCTGSGNTIQIFDTGDGRLLREWTEHAGPVRFAVYSPDDRCILSGAADGTVRIWNVITAAPERTLLGHHGNVLAGAYSPDGQWVVSGGEDGTVRLWEASTGTMRLVIQELHVPIVSICFSQDGRRVITGDADGAVRLWDVETGTETFSFLQHDGPVNAVASSPNGTCLVSGGGDRLVVFRKAISYSVDAGQRRKMPELNRQAEKLLHTLFSREGNWQQVAANIRADAGLPADVRRRALTLLVSQPPSTRPTPGSG